jgi:hypothetical protein
MHCLIDACLRRRELKPAAVQQVRHHVHELEAYLPEISDNAQKYLGTLVNVARTVVRLASKALEQQ